MISTLKKLAATLSLLAVAVHADAGIVFTFVEDGGTVKMMSSGTLDTTKLVPSVLPDGWGGTGTEHNPTPGDIDIMGGTSFGVINIQFGFNAGTDASAITNPGGPFAFSDFSVASIIGSKSFTTYSGFSGGLRQPGIGMVAADIVGGLWSPDQEWTYAAGETFASLGLNVGTFTVADAVTGEFITIRIGAAQVPEPGMLALMALCLGLAGAAGSRRRR